MSVDGLNMDKIIKSIVLISIIGFVTGAIFVKNNQTQNNTELRIDNAKNYILNMVSQPQTVVFHDESIFLNENSVVIKFTYKNGFGIIDTITMDIKD